MQVPEDLRYTSDHEWLRVDGDEAVVGITEYAASELGDVVFVELPAVGMQLESAQSFVGSSRVDLQACKLEYSIVSPK